MKKVIALIVGLMLILSFTACSSGSSNADKGNDGIIEDAGNAVNDTLDGAENVVDDITGSNNGNTANGTNTTNNTNN